MMQRKVGFLFMCIALSPAYFLYLVLQLRPRRSDNREIASVLTPAFLRLGWLDDGMS